MKVILHPIISVIIKSYPFLFLRCFIFPRNNYYFLCIPCAVARRPSADTAGGTRAGYRLGCTATIEGDTRGQCPAGYTAETHTPPGERRDGIVQTAVVLQRCSHTRSGLPRQRPPQRWGGSIPFVVLVGVAKSTSRCYTKTYVRWNEVVRLRRSK